VLIGIENRCIGELRHQAAPPCLLRLASTFPQVDRSVKYTSISDTEYSSTSLN